MSTFNSFKESATPCHLFEKQYYFKWISVSHYKHFRKKKLEYSHSKCKFIFKNA